MAKNQEYIPKSVAELADGSVITPQSAVEEAWLNEVASNPATTQEQKDRVARMGVLFSPTMFDMNFNTNKRNNYPTDLDPQLRQMIQES